MRAGRNEKTPLGLPPQKNENGPARFFWTVHPEPSIFAYRIYIKAVRLNVACASIALTSRTHPFRRGEFHANQITDLGSLVIALQRCFVGRGRGIEVLEGRYIGDGETGPDLFLPIPGQDDKKDHSRKRGQVPPDDRNLLMARKVKRTKRGWRPMALP